MKLDYLAIQDTIVDVIQSLEFERDKPLFIAKYAKGYDGEFDSYTLPEQYNPKDTYCFVKIRAARPDYTTSPNLKRPKAAFEVLLFIGSDTSSRNDAKEQVLRRLPIIHAALQGRFVKTKEGEDLGRLLWSVDEEQFARPNHVCWACVYSLVCEKIQL